jgi:hypothetical protein
MLLRAGNRDIAWQLSNNPILFASFSGGCPSLLERSSAVKYLPLYGMRHGMAQACEGPNHNFSLVRVFVCG